MQKVNGFAALLSTSLDLTSALHIMDYRAWQGLAVKREGNLTVGLCLTDEDTEGSAAIHGEIYGADLNLTSDAETDTLPRLLAKGDGSYSLILAHDGMIIFARDPLGTKPLYYARNKESFGIASDARILQRWFTDVNQAEPGVLYKATQTSLTQTSFSPLNNKIAQNYDAERNKEVQTISNLLDESVRRRVACRKKVVLGFSGGIDSTVLSLLAARYTKLTAATVCVKDSADYRGCESIAAKLGIQLQMIVVDEKMVKDAIKRLSSVTSLQGAMNASIACIVYLLAKFTRDSEADALMLGQLADELFGGYARYLKYLKISVDKVSSAIFSDVMNAHKLDFCRDEIASCPFTRLLLPYTSLDLVRYAINLPVRMKINADIGERKVVLREVAKRIGVDDELAKREKKAMQFSSGIYKIVSRLQQ